MTAGRTGGSAVVEALVAEEVEVVFDIPGTPSLDLYRALTGTTVRHVTARSEQGVGYAADGYARVTGRPGVCCVTSVPAVNIVAAPVGTAHATAVPILVVAPGPPRGRERADAGGLHEMRGHMAGVAERSTRVSSPGEAAAVVHEAFVRWQVARRRPVFLKVPVDVPADGETGGPLPLAYAPSPAAKDVANAARHLAQAELPVLLVGRGPVGAAEAVRRPAERLDAPVVTTVSGKGVLPEDHPLSSGASLRLAPAQHLLADADVVLIVGTALSDAELWGWEPDLPSTTVRVGLDAAWLGRNLTPTIALQADAATALNQAAAHAGLRCAGGAAGARGRARPRRAGARRLHRGRRAPAALGVKASRPDLPVVALFGDGAMMFSVATAVQERLPIPVVVVNDHGYTEIRNGMVRAGIEPVGVDLRTPDFTALGRAFGAGGVAVSSLRASWTPSSPRSRRAAPPCPRSPPPHLR